jgi:hypothetical protein
MYFGVCHDLCQQKVGSNRGLRNYSLSSIIGGVRHFFQDLLVN